MTLTSGDTDLAFQSRALEEVSRTFALTIPQLPTGLREVVANAYLLCRIADTIEDDPQMSLDAKRYFSDQFVRVLDGERAAMRFSDELYPQLSTQLPVTERELVLNTPRVVRITHGFDERQQRPMRRCVRIMSGGMASFQENASRGGLADMAAMDSYCYHVAGVVGQLLRPPGRLGRCLLHPERRPLHARGRTGGRGSRSFGWPAAQQGGVATKCLTCCTASHEHSRARADHRALQCGRYVRGQQGKAW